MRLAVFDTNVIVSAGIRPGGAPTQLMMDWVLEGQVQAVTSPSIVAEYREVVRRPKFAPYGFPPLWVDFLIEESLHLPEPEISWEAGPDPADIQFLALAHVSGAWLITGNARHFPQAIRRDVKVINPAEYLDHLIRS